MNLRAPECISYEDRAWCPMPDPISISRLPGSSLEGIWDVNTDIPMPNKEPQGGQGQFSPSCAEGHTPSRARTQETLAGNTSYLGQQLFLPTPAHHSQENKRSHTLTPQLHAIT